MLKSGRFLGQSGLRIRLGGKGPVAIDPEPTGLALGENKNKDYEQRYQRTIEYDVRPKRLRSITPKNIM